MRLRREKKSTPYDDGAGAGLQQVAGSGAGAPGTTGPAVTEARPQPIEPCPPTSTGGALAVTLLCCMPFGLISLAWGFTTRRRWRRGDQFGAEQASRMAELWMFAGVGMFVISFAVTLVIGIVQVLLPD